MTTSLTPHFTLEELIASDEAIRLSINNTPGKTIIDNLDLVASVIEDIRTIVNEDLGTSSTSIHINSGDRCSELNKAIGGASDSAHKSGLAADITCKLMTSFQLATLLIPHLEALGIDQLIYEGTWVHVGLAQSGVKPRNQVLTAIFKKGERTSYLPGIVSKVV